MNIAYSCNDFYVPQTGISIISLCENNKTVEDIVIYFIAKDCSQENIDILRKITESYNRKFVVVNFDDIAYDLKISNVGRHIETIYSKVFFSRIEGLEKIIYLDSDIVVVGNLQPLWNMDLSNFYMGVVQTFSKVKPQLGLADDYKFFNDGMAIVNVDYCRKNNLIEKVNKVVATYEGNPPTLSEGALNKVCQGKVKYISLRYNLMAGILYYALMDADRLACQLNAYTPQDLLDSCKHPVCIHYLTAFYNRPWFTPCTHPYKNEYLKYKAKSPWKDVQPQYKPLPLRIRLIDICYRVLGYRVTELIRKVIC